MMNRSHCGINASHSCHGDSALLLKIQQIDFSIYDVVLYLDAYPHCTEALGYYHSLLETRALLVAEYEHKHGPLTAFSNANKGSWDWTATPWPWQL